MKYIAIISVLVILSCNSNKYEWVVKYGNGVARSIPDEIIKDSDSYYLLGSNLKSKDESPDVILRLNKDGEVLWDFYAESFRQNNQDDLVKLKQMILSKSGLFVIGNKSNENEASSAYILKLNQQGKIDVTQKKACHI